MKFSIKRISDEHGYIPRVLMAGVVVLVLGVIGFAGWTISGNGITAKAAGYLAVHDASGVYVGACKVDINDSSHQIGLKVVNDNDTATVMQTKVYGSGSIIRSFNVNAKSTNYPTRYITTQAKIIISTNGTSVIVPVASLPGC